MEKKCPNMEYFLVRIFLYSDHKILRIWTLFLQWLYTILYKQPALVKEFVKQLLGLNYLQ